MSYVLAYLIVGELIVLLSTYSSEAVEEIRKVVREHGLGFFGFLVAVIVVLWLPIVAGMLWERANKA